MISDCRSPYQENLRPERSVACWLEARGSHQHNSTSDLRHTSMFWGVDMKERQKEKNTRIIVPSPSFSHTFEELNEWDLLNMWNQELLNIYVKSKAYQLRKSRSIHVYRFLFQPTSTNLCSEEAICPAECIFLTTVTPSPDFYRRSKYLVDIMDKLRLLTSAHVVYNIAQSIFVSISKLNQTDQQNPTRSIDIAWPEIYVYVL